MNPPTPPTAFVSPPTHPVNMLGARRITALTPFARQGVTLPRRCAHSLSYSVPTVLAALEAPVRDNTPPVDPAEVRQWRTEMAVWEARLARYKLSFSALADTARLALPELQHHELEQEQGLRGSSKRGRMRGDNFEALKERVHSENVTILTGAGASKQLNEASPSWASLLEQVGAQCAELLYFEDGKQDKRDEWFRRHIDQPLQSLDYDTPAQQIQLAMSSLGHYNDYRSMVSVALCCCEVALTPAVTHPCHVCVGSHHVFADLSVENDDFADALHSVVTREQFPLPVLTVNYDTLLERAMPSWRGTVKRFPSTHTLLMRQCRLHDFWTRRFARMGSSLVTTNVVHLHGLVNDHTSSQGFALTPIEYASQRGMLNLLRFLEPGLFKETHKRPSSLLFLGCNGTITDPHFWLLWIAQSLLRMNGYFNHDNPEPEHFLAVSTSALHATEHGLPSLQDTCDLIYRTLGVRIRPVEYESYKTLPSFLCSLTN